MKALVRNILRYCGREIRSVDAPTRSFARSLEILNKVISPSTVIDIGVAEGTPDLYRCFPSQRYRYLLVEANPNYGSHLETLRTHLNATIENVFCGDKTGEAQFNIYSDPRKSSVLEIHRDLDLEEQVTIPVERLDDLVEKHQLPPSYLVKIDVEGAEIDVINGARNTLGNAEAVIAEASVLPKFKYGPELADLVGVMKDSGFSVFDIIAGANHSRSRFLNQVDLIFVKTDAAFRLRTN